MTLSSLLGHWNASAVCLWERKRGREVETSGIIHQIVLLSPGSLKHSAIVPTTAPLLGAHPQCEQKNYTRFKDTAWRSPSLQVLAFCLTSLEEASFLEYLSE